MREELKKEAIDLLSNYLADIEYWCEVHDADGLNYVTSGTPAFGSMEDANAYRVMVKAVYKAMKNG